MADLKKNPKTFEQLAELHVAGLFAEENWNVYFPHRDEGFDFIAVKKVDDKFIIRPVQVKGKYPEGGKKDRVRYGYVGTLSQRDPRMVLAIPYFELGEVPTIKHVAFMPSYKIKEHSTRGYRCEPAEFVNGSPSPRKDYRIFFDLNGLRRVGTQTWADER
jgi:hypothetical protein